MLATFGNTVSVRSLRLLVLIYSVTLLDFSLAEKYEFESATGSSDKIPRSKSSTTTATAQISLVPLIFPERPAAAACRAIKKSLSPMLASHIMDGTIVDPGQYPHMAAIGYSAIGNEGGPYTFRCAGTLIHNRFVLTAAQCVANRRNAVPEIVRLGMSNFNDPDELPNRVEVPIKQIHVHPEYSQASKVHNVALLEFEKPVPTSQYISPTCLYTEEADPPSSSELYVAGWGVYKYRINHSYNGLLKIRMEIVPNQTCIHLCAAYPKSTGDACLMDSGGPLILIADESMKSFQQVGIISSDYFCGGTMPSLYMKVSAFLDYIESIVWPEGLV